MDNTRVVCSAGLRGLAVKEDVKAGIEVALGSDGRCLVCLKKADGSQCFGCGMHVHEACKERHKYCVPLLELDSDLVDATTAQLCGVVVLMAENGEYDDLDYYAHSVDEARYPELLRVAATIKYNTGTTWSQESVARVVAMVLANFYMCYEYGTMETLGVGLHRKVNLLNHACTANAFLMVSPETGELVIKALRDMSSAEQITLSYVGCGFDRYERQKRLREDHYFLCNCVLCRDQRPERIACWMCLSCGKFTPRECICPTTTDYPHLASYLAKVEATFLCDNNQQNSRLLLKLTQKLLGDGRIPPLHPVLQRLLLYCMEQLEGLEERFSVLFIYLTEAILWLEPDTPLRPLMFKYSLDLLHLGELILTHDNTSHPRYLKTIENVCSYIAHHIVLKMGSLITDSKYTRTCLARLKTIHPDPSPEKIDVAFTTLYTYFTVIITTVDNNRPESGLSLYNWLETNKKALSN
ncbi:hypothetical protein TRICI_005913 [Trichomonascus ciferrii]|uniref:SET domain-containing protein n=1 Tax=Trichomonascus ciferrii TaxID=44093 RepID=A0A642UNC1_9ASCO|nr:hypothetical protein TRICI_005913 [Trichomonascus ciferrii]